MSRMIYSYNHIIWDWNGTILDDVHLCLEIINTILGGKKLNQITLNEYRDHFTIPVKKYYEKLGLVKNDLEFKIYGKEWSDEYEKRKLECSIFNDIIDTMNIVKERGIQQSILSAYMQQTLDEIVDHYNLSGFFENIIGSDNVYGKGKIDIGRKLINKINGHSAKILLIGDTLHDFEVAEAIGVDCILISRGHQSTEVLNQKTTKVFNSLAELINKN